MRKSLFRISHKNPYAKPEKPTKRTAPVTKGDSERVRKKQKRK